jgi:DNA-binding MarR family transcriptional regulator
VICVTLSFKSLRILGAMSSTDLPDADPAADDTPWLTPSEGAAWWPLSGVISKLPAALEQQLQRDAGLSHFEYMVLSQLSSSSTRTLRMSDLADLANGSLSRLSHAVSRLENRGWVRREPCPQDGRYTHAILTDAGHAKVVATAPGHVRAVRELVVDALTPAQLESLREIGEAIMKRIEPDAVWPPPPRGRRDAGDTC